MFASNDSQHKFMLIHSKMSKFPVFYRPGSPYLFAHAVFLNHAAGDIRGFGQVVVSAGETSSNMIASAASPPSNVAMRLSNSVLLTFFLFFLTASNAASTVQKRSYFPPETIL
jgi:hypothetical protein